jgi:hypothetical protein
MQAEPSDEMGFDLRGCHPTEKEIRFVEHGQDGFFVSRNVKNPRQRFRIGNVTDDKKAVHPGRSALQGTEQRLVSQGSLAENSVVNQPETTPTHHFFAFLHCRRNVAGLVLLLALKGNATSGAAFALQVRVFLTPIRHSTIPPASSHSS